MKQVDNQKKRRRAATVIALVLVLALVLSALAPLLYAVQAQTITAPVRATHAVQITGGQNTLEEVQDKRLAPEVGLNGFSLNLSVGFDQEYIVGQVTPITGVITNLGGDFEGEICIRVGEYSGYESESTRYSEYYQELSLQKDGAKKINMVVNLGVVRKTLEFSLKDKQGNVVYLKNIPVKALDPATIAVGILTENLEGTNYLSALNMGASSYGEQFNKTIFFNQGTFPKRVDVLSNLKALIIEDFDTKTLDNEQRNALMNFTANGGMLILGTGPNSSKVLGRLTEMADFQIGENLSLNNLTEISEILQTNASQYGAMAITEIQATGLQEIFSEEGKTISSAMDYGSGKIILHNFALSLRPVALIPDMVILLRTMYQNEAPALFEVDSDVEPISNQLFWMADSFLLMDEGSLVAIFISIGVYILLVGPVLYIVLKKKNKREKGWIFIPVMAVTFTLIIFGIGRGSDYQNNLINSVSVTDLPDTGGNSIAHLAASIKTSSKGKVSLQMDNALQTLRFNDGGRYYSGDNDAKVLQRRVLAAADEGTAVSFMDTARWGSNSFTADIPMDMGGGFSSTLQYKNDNHLNGKLTNNTNMDFEDILVSINNVYFKYDSLLAGEDLEVDVEVDSEIGNYYDVLYTAFGIDGQSNWGVQEMIREGKLTRQEGFDILQKIRLIEQVHNPDFLSDDSEGIVISVYAFNDEPILQGEKQVNGKAPIETHLGLYQSSFVQRWREMDSFTIPFGMITPQIDDYSQNQKYPDFRYYSESGGTVKLDFAVPDDVSISAFTLSNNADIANYIEEPTIYNYETQAFEPLSLGEYTNTKAYIGEVGQITLQLAIQPETEIDLLVITMKGVGNHAAN